MFANLTGRMTRRTTTFASLALALAVGGAALLLANNAHALPLVGGATAIQGAQDSDVTLVRDGCGRGMRFSNNRGRCVRDGDGRRGDQVDRQINRMINRAIGGGSARHHDRDCGRGFHFSNRRGRCVRN